MDSSVTKLAVIGSTGSIGRQALDVVRALPGRFEVAALAAGGNTALLAQQIREFRPRFVYSFAEFKPDTGEVLPLEQIAAHQDVDMVLVAAAGKAGLEPTLAAVKAGKKVALANKESLVTAGAIITREAKKSGAQILPVDSEHSAVWQCLSGEVQPPVRLILTASGGPFWSYPAEKLAQVTAAQALKHPSWQMGRKVTIDSATLMNKGLEIIEAHWLFNMPVDKITVLVHPQSIVHSMVEYADGAIKAQLSYPDMRLPIQYALTYPERLANAGLPRLNWNEVKSLNFEMPDMERFPCLRLGIEAGQKGGTYPAVLCAADEVAVEMFLAGRIKFTDIPRLIETVLERHSAAANPNIEEIEAADTWARHDTIGIVEGLHQCC
ncbi:MAG: 1-deoxy-D-xylulose-5-phosphate reductoisomerase [Dehalococcoidales bacterium]|nr:1-deoxy-D-xylulose-5-phosphate reductoisomerase [Dehalococcoidales bacterium]